MKPFKFFTGGLFLAIFSAFLYSETLDIEKAGKSSVRKLQEAVAAGRYSFEDLSEAGRILYQEKKWLEAQRVLEIAQEIRPKDLEIKKALAKIYQVTEQSERLAALAESVASYLLPGGEEDEFYEKMLTVSIRLNARGNQEFAWKIFMRLFTTLKDRPGRLSKRIKELEQVTYVPFLSRIYRFLQDRNLYGDFLWGRVGDHYLVQGEFSKARFFLEQEFRKRKFDRVYLYSQALALFSLREFSLAHIFVNVALALNSDEKVISKTRALKRALQDHPYGFSWEDVRKEADLYFEFHEKTLGLKKLQELLLSTEENPENLIRIGRILLEYPERWNTWSDGRNYLVAYSQVPRAKFDLLLDSASLLYKKGYIEELAPLLRRMEQVDPRAAKESETFKRFRAQVAKTLHRDLKLLEAQSEPAELAEILKLLIRFDASLKEPYLSLGSLMERRADELRQGTKILHENFQKEVQSVTALFERAPRNLWKTKELQYYLGKFYGLSSPSKRRYSQEITHLKRALKEDPQFHKARIGLAEVFLDSAFYRQAFLQAEMALGASKIPEDLLVKARNIGLKSYRESASQAYAEENYFLTLDYLKKAFHLNGDTAIDRESSLWYAHSLIYAEQHNDASEFLSKLLTQFGGDPEIYYLLALSREGVYKLKEAMSYYRKALEFGKEGDLFVEQCRKNLKHLEEIQEKQDGGSGS